MIDFLTAVVLVCLLFSLSVLVTTLIRYVGYGISKLNNHLMTKTGKPRLKMPGELPNLKKK